MNLKGIQNALFANWPAKIISLTAAVVLSMFYRINSMEERFFSVPLSLEPPQGLALADPYPKSVRITLRGDADSIFSVLEEDIEVFADFGKFKSEGKYRISLHVDRKGSALNIEPLEIRVEPAEIKVTLEQKLEKSLEIVPSIKGNPAHGYELVQYSVTPNMVEIAGPRSKVQRINSLTVEDIDLTGRTEDFLVTVRIIQDNSLIQFPKGAAVEFRGVIRAAEIIKTFEPIDIISLDLSPKLRLADPLPEGSIKLQGSQVSVESMDPGQLRLVLDCSAITDPGEYLLNPVPDIPAGYVVLKYEPQELLLIFLETTGDRSSR